MRLSCDVVAFVVCWEEFFENSAVSFQIPLTPLTVGRQFDMAVQPFAKEENEEENRNGEESEIPDHRSEVSGFSPFPCFSL